MRHGRFIWLGMLVMPLLSFASGAEALIIARESFDSYSAAGSFTVDGGTGWADSVSGNGTSVSPGLSGCFKSMRNPSWERDLDLGSPALDPYVVDVIVDSQPRRFIGGAGVVIWTSFYLRVDSATDFGLINFRGATFRTGFRNLSADLLVNPGSGQSATITADLTSATRVVAKWVYTGYRNGQLLVWLDPTATSEAGLGPPDGTTPHVNGFIESFDRIEFTGGGFDVDEFVIATSYEEAVGGAGCNVPDGEQAGYTTSGSLEQVVAVNSGDVCDLSLWVGKRSDGAGTWGRWYVQLTTGGWSIQNVLNGSLAAQTDEWVQYQTTFTVGNFPNLPIKLRLKGQWGFEVYDLVALDCGGGDVVSNGSFESPVIPDGTWTTFGNPAPDDWTTVGGGAGLFNPNTAQMNDFF